MPAKNREHWRAWAGDILAHDDAWMILDVEATGGGLEDDITEVAAVTPGGRVLVDTLIRPTIPIPPFVVALTGITDAMVAPAPPFAAVYTRVLKSHLTGRGVIAYDDTSDIRILRRNIQRHCHIAWNPIGHHDLMRAYASYRDERYPAGHARAGRVRMHRLESACHQMDIPHPHAHRALGDCLASAALLRAMAG
jgi:DNA polymerase-3 subunit epsilon